jgi:uncharacterized protein YdaU (DUF1376 family)
MHYYQFNIGDYHAHTSHLDPLEDIAYRRMIDYCYLNEIPLPKDVVEIARLIRMRSHTDCIAVVLREFFTLVDGGYIQQRIGVDLAKYHEKSEKAKNSANARWNKQANKDAGLAYANALRPECEGNANHKPLTNNHKPLSIGKKATRFTAPEKNIITEYFKEKGAPVSEAEKFFYFYESKNWMVGRNKMKKWESAASGWISRNGTETNNAMENRFE